MLVEKNVPLQPYNTFHIVAKAHSLVRVTTEADVQAVVSHAELGLAPKFVLGKAATLC